MCIRRSVIATILLIFLVFLTSSKCVCFKIFSSVIGETEYEIINEEYRIRGFYEIKYRDNELFEQNFNSSILNRTEEVFNECLMQRPDKIALQVCVCSSLHCVEFYCEPNQFLNKSECQNITGNESLVYNESPDTLFLSMEHKVFGKIKSIKKLHQKPISKENYEIPVVTLMHLNHTYYDLFQIEFNCQRKIDGNIISKQEKHSYVIHSISLISLFILIVFFTCLPETRANTIGKSWIMYTSISFTNYLMTICLFIYRDGTSDLNQMILVVRGVAIIYSFTEFAVYFWLNVISFDAFRVLK